MTQSERSGHHKCIPSEKQEGNLLGGRRMHGQHHDRTAPYRTRVPLSVVKTISASSSSDASMLLSACSGQRAAGSRQCRHAGTQTESGQCRRWAEH